MEAIRQLRLRPCGLMYGVAHLPLASVWSADMECLSDEPAPTPDAKRNNLILKTLKVRVWQTLKGALLKRAAMRSGRRTSDGRAGHALGQMRNEARRGGGPARVPHGGCDEAPVEQQALVALGLQHCAPGFASSCVVQPCWSRRGLRGEAVV